MPEIQTPEQDMVDIDNYYQLILMKTGRTS